MPDQRLEATAVIPFGNILFPVDFSEHSRAAAPFVLSLAQRYHAKVTLVNAMEPPPPIYGGMNTVYADLYDFEGVQTDRKVALTAFAADELPKVQTLCVVETGSPSQVIRALAPKADLIAMPTCGHGLVRRMVLGSTTADILRLVTTPVWTDAHTPEPSHRAHPLPRRILVALDLEPESNRTLEFALRLGQDANATVEVFHSTHASGEEDMSRPGSRLREAVAATADAQDLNIDQQMTEVALMNDAASVAERIRDQAIRTRADLIVIGRGSIRHGLGRLFNNCYDIVRASPCPVLSV
jgi:nucleotide-binding universal stress UspA family protein